MNAIYTSNNATIIRKSLIFAMEKNIDIKKSIAFVLIDNTSNESLKAICNKVGIKLIEVDLTNIKNKSVYMSEYLLNLLPKYNIKYLFVNCDKILKKNLLDLYFNKIINIHPALLPSYRGLKPIDRAINEKAFLLGNTAHFIDENIDEGIPIMQSLVHYSEYKAYEDVLNLQITMFFQILEWVNKEKLYIKDGRCIIKDGNYKINRFIPNIENKTYLIGDFNFNPYLNG